MIFINSFTSISAQGFFDNINKLGIIKEFKANLLKIQEPIYSSLLNPIFIRRFSKIQKASLFAAINSLNTSKINNPDAIVVGTGLGCIQDTEKFLLEMIENKEELLQPTNFIQSTHNSIASNIAIYLKCNSYNLCYSNDFTSFENVLIDVMLKFKMDTIQNALIGAADEMTDYHFNIYKNLGYWKEQSLSNLNLLQNTDNSTIYGENINFFAIQREESEQTFAKIKDIKIYTNYDKNIDNQAKFANEKISEFLQECDINILDIDLIMLGINGNKENDKVYYHLIANTFQNNAIAYYKHLCGESYTSTAFALSLCCQIIKNQEINKQVLLKELPQKEIKNILIYNFINDNHLFILLNKVK